ncbi:MAG: TonB-dependent receptor [Pseudomonadota bacterium]
MRGIQRGRRQLPFGSGVMAAFSVLAGSTAMPVALAQEDTIIEEVVVTGSRLRRSNESSSQPLALVTGEQMARAGQPDIGEILNDQPALLASVTGTNSIDASANAAGTNFDEANSVGGAALDLRGMGIARTLVLVNGRRHVSGVEGTSAVDINTIPPGLIERVEVLTGGASAVYGADAVTGVVNFVLKDDFEGFEFDIQSGISGESDAESSVFNAIFGRNFGDGRGNITLAGRYETRVGLRQGDRSFLAGDGLWDNDTNPALRFQTGDIQASSTPNFAQFYNFENTGLFPVGLNIPSADDFISDYTAEFGAAPSLTQTELDLIDRAANAFPQAILPGRTFNITSPYGVVAAGDFGSGATPLGSEPDLDGNGVSDCLDSFTGYNSSLAGAGSFGAAGGCWVIDENGNPQPYRDGLVSDNFNQFGASQSFIAGDRAFVVPDEKKWSIDFNGRYEFAPQLEAFFETKYVYQEVDFGAAGHNFTDLLYGAPDNPFLPEALRPLANNDGVGFIGPGGLYISRDSDDWGPNVSTNERTTYRIVAGLRGEFESAGLSYEISGNYGKFKRELLDPEDQIADRFFAAIDVVTDPATGEPVCRSDLDPNAFPRTTPFDIFSFVGGGVDSSFFTFTPGDGQCQPANIWGGRGAISQEAIDFITRDRTVEDEIEQTVFTAFITGQTDNYFELQGGGIDFAFGFEYREEDSSRQFDSFDEGIILVDGVTSQGVPFSAGDSVGDVSAAGSLGEDPSLQFTSGSGGYDVWDVFAEISLPLLADVPGAKELTVDAAWRRADYSTFGSNTTYKFGGVWAPSDELRMRGSYSRAVRVPNIFELFSPDQGGFFRPADPCDATQIGLAADPALREANCIADLQAFNVSADNIFNAAGDYAFEDPLSAGFPGVVGGNPDLQPEEATTRTLGIVVTPAFAENLVFTVDYWEIDIQDAIASISDQNIVNGCYDGATLDNPFCGLINRNPQTTSAQSGGLTFLRQIQLNFGAVKAEGWDLTMNYGFQLGGLNFDLNTSATRQTRLDLIEPDSGGDGRSVDPELGESRRPKWSALATLGVSRDQWRLAWQTQYLSKQVLAFEDGAEIETVDQNFGPAGFSDETYIHSLTGSWALSEAFTLYGGIDNVLDERPFRTEFAYPVGPRGRYFFLGLNARL